MTSVDRKVFAQRWADAIAASSYVSTGHEELVAHLFALTDQLVEAVLATEFDPSIGRRIGSDLIAVHFPGTDAISETLVLIIDQLPDLLDSARPGIDVASRVVRLAGDVAAGYARAFHERSLDEQDALYRVGLQAGRKLEQALSAGQPRFREVLYSSPVGIAISESTGRMVQINRSLEDILGYSPGELLGRQLSELFPPDCWPIVQECYRGLRIGQEFRFQDRFPLRGADGETRWIQLDAAVLPNTEQAPEHIVTIVDDFTDVQLLGQRLRHQTLHDQLTGLPNRHHLITHLEEILARLEPSAVLTLMHLDLDGFSAINNGLGHLVGDQLLDVVARRLERVVADHHAMVARLSADEYAILLEPKPGDTVPDVSALAEAINTELAEPYYIDGIGIALTATIGIVQRQAGGATPEELMRAANATLRRLREQGPRQWAPYDPDLDAADRAKLQLAAALPGALEAGQLHVTYQPVVTLDTHQLVGIEAGLSWAHPQLGELSHDQCMRAAEQTGVVHELGQWLLRTASNQAVSWRQRLGSSGIPVVVNLAPSQAQDPDLVAKIRAILDKTGLKPAELELRAPVAAIRTVTGELAGQGGEQAEDNLRVLTELGVHAGLHDFSGGIGALCCLANLPIRVVRTAPPTPQQLTNDLSHIRSKAAQATIHIIRAAKINVVAYPVNNTEQAACWTKIGTNWAIGALFGPPGPPQHIEKLLSSQPRE